jgi:O-antigen/teichoic acid export membrane protein
VGVEMKLKDGMVAQGSRWWRQFRPGAVTTRWAGVLTSSSMVVAGVGLVQALVVARSLGPERYGLAALIIAYPSLWSGLLDAKAKQAAVKYLGEFHAKGAREHALAVCKLSYATDGVLGLLACGIVLATLPVAAALAPNTDVTWLVALYSIGMLPHALTGTSRAALSVLGRFELLATMDVGLSVARAVLVIGPTLLGAGVEGVVIGTALSFALTGIVYGCSGYLAMRRSWSGSWLSARPAVVRDRWGEIARFLLNNSVDVTVTTVLGNLDVLLLAWVRATAEVGAYKLAKNIAGMLAYVRVPLETVVYAELARLSGLGQRSRFRKELVRLGFGIGVPAGAVCLTTVVLIPYLLPLVVGAEYHPAVELAQILLLGASWQTIFFWVRAGYMASNRFGTFVVSSGIACAGLLLTWAGVVDAHGAWGMVIAAVIVGTAQEVILALSLFRTLARRENLARVGDRACELR